MSRARSGIRPVLDHEPTRGQLSRLFRAATPADVAAVLFDEVPRLRDNGACLLWSTHWPRDVQSYPRSSGHEALTAVAADVVAAVRADGQAPSGMRVIHDDGEDTAVVLYCP